MQTARVQYRFKTLCEPKQLLSLCSSVEVDQNHDEVGANKSYNIYGAEAYRLHTPRAIGARTQNPPHTIRFPIFRTDLSFRSQSVFVWFLLNPSCPNHPAYQLGAIKCREIYFFNKCTRF